MSLSPVIPGAESFFYPGNSTGILICHGFNGTPQSVEYLGSQFAEKGYTVYAPRLKGHGSAASDLKVCSYQDWIQNLEDAYCVLQQTCSRVYILGQSMGGALAIDLASKTNCDGVITVNAALKVPQYEQYRKVQSPLFIPDGSPDIKDPSAKEITYPEVPLHSIKQLLSLMDKTSENVKKTTCPLLLFYSVEDHVVPAECSFYLYDQAASPEKELIALKQSYHVASLDYDKEHIIKNTLRFIEEHSKKEMAS
ncbi:alpha/beta fold hydrolase [Bacillus sp. MUM 13]|uniref:alpha/beta hydrolase n=1 Tax=Bacillus sp. MUM 13 TaxID=1678001 RepID=UPI0009F708A0|nr:alpha/beta fold hydrolase [Bacillus sp. MUM 13]